MMKRLLFSAMIVSLFAFAGCTSSMMMKEDKMMGSGDKSKEMMMDDDKMMDRDKEMMNDNGM
jgi:hypothetical protein